MSKPTLGALILLVVGLPVPLSAQTRTADVETGARVDTKTAFQAASISKPVAAMGLLKAVQDGLFGLDDDINDILESWTLDGGGVTVMQQALSDPRGRPFEDIMRDDVLRPIGMSNRVLSRESIQEMLSPVGVGPYAVGFSIGRLGEGWYFSHGGSNWGFRCTLMAHKVKGYGLAIMTNADQGGAVMRELSRRIQLAYEWDSVADPVRRGNRPATSDLVELHPK